MTDAESRFRDHVLQIQEYSALSLSEADTRAYLIDPMLRILGYDGINDLRREVTVPATKEAVDYELMVDGQPHVIVEAKALRNNPTDQHAAQCVQYARNIRNIVLMRPINSIIEFKQIVGRGTRLYDGKDYFTVYDFVNAHHHFSDPEWDGEPLEPEPRIIDGTGEGPTVPLPGDGEDPSGDDPTPSKIEVKLADGKARAIQHMVVTTFWHPDGTPMSAQQFLEELFGKLPEFFKDESELRALWSDPSTRAKLLEGLAEEGFGAEQLAEIQRLIDAENSDLFDVLAHVAYALQPITRDNRAANARISISTHFDSKQQAFLDFVLAHYVSDGVEELDPSKLAPLLNLRYGGSIADAIHDLGEPQDIASAFAGFQKYLYEAVA